MTKHTPGPWEIGERVPTARIDNARMIRPADHHNYEYGATAIIGTSEADARLISAAPDLLYALRFYMAQFGQDLIIRGIDFDASQVQADKIARDAIFKATGENK